jgi:hypothetical protein
MDLLTQFLHIKDEPMAVMVFFTLILYKGISLITSYIKHKFEKPDTTVQALKKDIAILKIYNKDLPAEDRMESLFDYLYAGFNGDVLDYGKTNIILPDKEKWIRLKTKKMEKRPDFDPKKNFEKAMDIINRSIFDRSTL